MKTKIEQIHQSLAPLETAACQAEQAGRFRFARSNLRIAFVFFFAAVTGRFAYAQQFTQFDLGGTHWAVPAPYVQNESLPASGAHSVTLQFELPKFTPVNPPDFVGVTPGDALPVLSVNITDDPNAPSGQALLDSLMAKVQTNCVWCVGDSSLGGKTYSNYALNGPQPGHLDNGAPFSLYVNNGPQGNWFAVCYFSPALRPLPCERTLKISPLVTVMIKFPREYMSQVFEIGAEVRALLEVFQLPIAYQPALDAHNLALPPTPCWSPEPGSPDAQILPLRVGPELWHIPVGYAGAPGPSQIGGTQVNGLVFFLKLPGLEPMEPNDPSPFLIHGQGQYVDLTFSFEPDAMLEHPEMEVGHDGFAVFPKWRVETYLGKDPFIEYREFATGPAPVLPEVAGRQLVSDEKAAGFQEFPPEQFDCGLFSPDESAGCNFRVDQRLSKENPKEPDAGYMINYSFSRDYYSQIKAISRCVENLFKTISD